MSNESDIKIIKKKPPKKGNGEGSIVKMKPGKWKVTITVGRNDDGKIQRKVFYGKTKEEAVDKANKYKLDNKAGLIPNDDKITVQEWVKIWIFEYKVNELKNSSLSRYEGIYRNYIKDSSLGKIKLKDLRSSHLQTYYNVLKNEKNRTPDTIKSINKMLKSSLNQALIENYIVKNYCNHVVLPKLEQKDEVEIFTMEEQKQFVNATKGHRHRAIFLLDLASGLRISELIGLRWSDIDFENRELSVQQIIRRETKLDLKKGEKVEGAKTELKEGTPKTLSSRRTIPLLPEIIKELKIHQLMQNSEKAKAGEAYVNNNLVFPNEIGEPTDARNLTRSYERLLKKSGIKYKKFHALRHTFATRLFEKEVPLKTVSKLLGHSDISITANIYTHVMPNEKLKAVEKLNDLFAL